MTKPLYDDRPYDRAFGAKVLSCEAAEEGYRVVLDQTLFFPEQGGQSCDLGTIDGILVKDVQIKDEIIYHTLEKELAVGSEVSGEINWEHRFSNMQQHTGEHIYVGLAHNKYGAENVGFHLSDNTVTLDLDVELTKEQVLELELMANQVIASDVAVSCYYPASEEIASIEYRSKKEIDGALRLVEIEGVDICACCAPHVSSTGQVGLLKVVSFGKYKGGMRIYILCGFRALADYNSRMVILEDTYQLLNCQEQDIPAKVRTLIGDNKQLKYDMSQIKAKQLYEQIEKYPSEIEDITIFTSDLDAKTMRDGVNIMVEKHSGLCAIFSGDDEAGYNFVIGSQTRDCAAIAAGLRELLSAKGGGSKQMAQGSVESTRVEIERTL